MELKDKEIMQAMSDEEDIMKKLQKVANRDCNFCWQKGENCDGDECEKVIAEKILNIYNRQQAEIEKLQSLCTAKDVIITEQEAEIERLQKKYDRAMDNLNAVLKERAGEQNV